MTRAAGSPRARREAVGRVLRHRVAVVSGGISVALVLAGLLAPWIVPYDPYAQNLGARLKPPTMAHWLGTDEVGRDVLSRVVYGVRVSYGIALVSVLLTPVLAVPLGLVAGYYGGWIDTVVMRLIDVMLAFPGLVLALVVVSILGSGAFSVILATAVFSIPIYARVVRAEILTRRTVDYTLAARAAGQTDLGIIARHLLPNIAGTLIVLSALRMASVLLASAALGFLGLGVQPPVPEWGLMISATRDYIRAAPHVIVGPGLALALSVLAFNLLGDGLRDVLDPTMRQRLMRTSAS
jgi:ABC-type dipeptide/oligopeptide/nickel transport system permease subunit